MPVLLLRFVRPRRPGIILLLAALLWLAGCGGDGSLGDERNPFYIKGKRLTQEEKYDEAAQAFEKCLRLSPYSYKAHLQLAMLYEDRLKDPLQAVYHYRAYLQKAPKTEEVGTVHKWLARAECTTMLALADKYPEAVESFLGRQPTNPTNGLTPREQILLDRLKQASAQIQQLRDAAGHPTRASATPPPARTAAPAHQAAPAASATPPPGTAAPPAVPPAEALPLPAPGPAVAIVPPLPATTVPAPTPPPAPPPPPQPPARRPAPESAPAPFVPARVMPKPTTATGGRPVAQPVLRQEATAPARGTWHKVQPGDTLITLSRHYYGTTNLWTKIRDANRTVLRGGTVLKAGMTVQIPPR